MYNAYLSNWWFRYVLSWTSYQTYLTLKTKLQNSFKINRTLDRISLLYNNNNKILSNFLVMIFSQLKYHIFFNGSIKHIRTKNSSFYSRHSNLFLGNTLNFYRKSVTISGDVHFYHIATQHEWCACACLHFFRRIGNAQIYFRNP